MPSPYGSLENASLTFKVTSGYAIDPDTGISLPIEGNQTYRCHLHPKSTAGVLPYEKQAGIDRYDEQLEGVLLEPVHLNSKILPGAIAQGTYEGVTGQFELQQQPIATRIYSRLARDQIAVSFRRVGVGNNAN